MGKAYKFGFKATAQEKNTINKQISRMQGRGYIFPENIREKIKSTKNLPDFLYKHSTFKPFTGGKEITRVPWEAKGVMGKKIEQAINRINARNRRLAEKGFLPDYKPLTPSNIGPYTHGRFGVKGGDKLTKSEIYKEFEKRWKKLYKDSLMTDTQWLAKKMRHALRNMEKSLRHVFKEVYYTPMDQRLVNKLFRDIKKKLKSMTPEQLARFFKTSGFEISLIWSSDQEKIAANIREFCEELGLVDDHEEAITAVERAIGRIDMAELL